MQLISSAFQANQPIPAKYTGEGANISPPLSWKDLPERCKSLALICEDPDAPPAKGKDHPFVHWVFYNIPHHLQSLPEGIAPGESPNFPYGSSQGLNSFGELGYGGPMPPPGHGVHHYIFSLYALRRSLELDPGLTKAQLIEEMRGQVIEIAKLVGTFERIATRRAG